MAEYNNICVNKYTFISLGVIVVIVTIDQVQTMSVSTVLYFMQIYLDEKKIRS